MESTSERALPDAPPDAALDALADDAPADDAVTVEPPPRIAVRPLPPLVPEQLAAGLLAALAMALLDVVYAALDTTAPRVSAGELTIASLHLVALYLPVGALVGLAAAALTALARETPALGPVRARLSWRALVRRDPEAFATGVGVVVGMAALAFLGRGIFDVLTVRVHRADLAAWAMGGLAAVAALVALLAGAATRVLLLPLARRVGPVASSATLALLAVAAVVALAQTLLRPALIDATNAYGVAPIAWAPAALLAYVLALSLARFALRRAPRRRAWIAAGLAVLGIAAAWVASGLSYGVSNRVRSVIEQRSVIGRHAVRRYAAITDMDRDGHAWAFGGRDCDDFDASVHPGAFDAPGDGVDADCFHGDGSPEVQDLSDGRYGQLPASLPTRPHVVLVTIDALRPDHLGVAGYARNTSPNIDRFARGAVRFETVIAQSSRSIRSIPAMMTGRYPSQIAYGPEYLYPALLPQNQTVAELLTQHGYQTAVTMGTDYFHRTRGFFQGFADVDEILSYKPPREQAVDTALRQLETLDADGRPFFLWVHLFGVHGSYLDPPAPSRFGDQPIDEYDTEILLADVEFQRILAALEERDLARETVVVLASDHGEAFLEHGQRGHATTLYEEELRSTLIIRVPGVAPRVVSQPVGLFDVGPTILNAARVPVPAPIPARSLVPLMRGERDASWASRLLFSELMPDGLFPFDIKSIRRGDDKLLWWVQDGTVQLFDLEQDPGERDDLSDDRQDDAHELLGLLQAWVAQSNRPENRTDRFIAEHRLPAPPAQMTHPLGLRFPGLFTVLGCDLPRTEFTVGETIPITCYYRVDGETDLDLFFRVLIEAPAGVRLPRDFHAMHYPLHGRYHTNRWRRGEILADPMPIVIPPELTAPMEVRLTFSVHERGQGLQGFEQAGRTAHSALIDTLRIAPRPR